MEKKRFQIPHTMVLLTVCIIVMAILTYILPAGVYDRVESASGRTVVDPNSFHYVEPTPVGPVQLMKAIPEGFEAAVSVVVLTLFSGGCIMILRKIGIIDAAIEAFANKIEGRGIVAVPILMFVFALIDCFIGTPELCMVYIPIVMPLMLKLGFDTLTTMGTVVLGSAIGFTAGIANPFTIVIGQKLCDLPLYSGWQLRIVTFIVFYLVGVIYMIRYGKKVLADPSRSSMYQEDIAIRERVLGASSGVQNTMTFRKKVASVFTVALFIFMFVGIMAFGWDVAEMSGLFLVIGVGAGLIAGLDTRTLCVTFSDGCKDVMMGALFISIARGTAIVMEEGQIIDTIVHGCATFLTNMPSQFVVLGIFLIVTVLNFFVSSGSGKAVMLFPILSPLADICGITRQTAILAYQFGDGLTNMFWPTNGVQGACLGIIGIPWNKWAKFYGPLLLIWCLLGCVFLLIAQAIQFGPF